MPAHLSSFLSSLVLAFVSTLAFVPVARLLAPRAGYLDLPRPDRFHARAVPLLGGPACLAATALGIISGRVLVSPVPPDRWAGGTMVGSLGMLLIGLVDDRRAIPAASKGLAQGLTIAIALLVWRPSGALSGWVPLAISWLVFMVLVNAWNYLDHADGIFTTVGASASLILAIGCGLLSETRSPAIGSVDRLPALISLSLLGALLGFLVFNRPPARIFLGDAGSLPIGFLLAMTGAWILDRGNVLLRPAVAAAFAVPVADMLLVSVTRLREGRNPFEGGREHTGHRLASRFGPMAAVLVIGTVSVLFGVLGLTLGSSLPAMALVLVSAGILLTAALLARIPPPA